MNVSVGITDGIGTIALADGNYEVSANTLGYNNSSISPKSILLTDEEDTIDFIISATGTLTLHVVETDTNLPIIGAKFYRCSSIGVTYGDIITTDAFGNATFKNVPFAENDPPSIYFRQIESDDKHSFDDGINNIKLVQDTKIINVYNNVK